MRSRGIRGGKKYGTPTINPPRPQAIDDYTGFKVPHESLRKDWQGLFTQDPDVRNPQDFLRGIKDNMTLPNPRPEVANQFVAQPLAWEDGSYMYVEGNSGDLIYSEGIMPGETL